MSGIQIKSGTGSSSIRTVGAGTLTGLATRNSDGKKMLVTNMHVMAGEGDNGEFREPTGNEEMYQDFLTSNKRVGTNLVWVPIASGQSNVADVAMCELGDDVDANFILHDHPNHGSRKIIAGVVEPTKGMELTMLGASTGERPVTVTEVGEDRNLNGRGFTGLVRLNRRGGSIAWDGDSGAPCLFKVREGVYQIACIVFAASVLDPIAWAFPASVAERELGITFGNRPPVADAGPDQNVTAGDTVTLDASRSSDPDGDALTYRWEQVFGSERAAIAERGITLSDNTAAAPTFTAPSNPRILTIKLTVTDLYGATATDTVKVTVRATVPPAAPANLRATPSDRQVSLRWDYPDNTSITRYEYRLRLGANSWGDWTTVPSSGAATVGYVKVGLTNGTSYSFQLRAVNEHGAGPSAEAGPVTPTAPTPPDPPTPWRDTESTRGCGPDKEKEQSRTNGGNRETRWVAAPEAETWGSWSRTGRTRGSNQSRKAEESRTSNCNNTQTRWVAYPEPETWGSWSRTGNTRGSGIWHESEEARTSSYGNRQTRWVDDPESETWGSWFRTGNTRGSAQNRESEEARTSSYGNRQTRWVDDPESETWGSWFRTGNTRGSAQNRESEEARTSSYANRQTRWVPYPAPETWGSWSRTGNRRLDGDQPMVEEERTSSYGNRQTRWVPVL